VIPDNLINEHGFFPMRTVAKLTGVNPITLRAWERRYGLIKPIRTEKGHRLYRQQDIKDIQRITAMLELGVSIGQVPVMLEHAPRSEPVAIAVDTVDVHENNLDASASWLQNYRSALSTLDEAALTILEANALGLMQLDDLLAMYLIPLMHGMDANRLLSAQVDAEYRLLQNRLTIMLANAARNIPDHPQQPPMLVASLPPERGMFAMWHLVWSLRRAGMDARLFGSGVPAQTLLQAMQTQSVQTLVLLLEHKPPTAVLGSQLPLLAAAGHKIIAVGHYAFELGATLAELGIHHPGSKDDAPLNLITQTLRRENHTVAQD
jgi:DNA-binding transcriptional MerR regulator